MRRARGKRRPHLGHRAAAVSIVLFAVGAICFGGEIYLRRTGTYANYSEKNGLPFDPDKMHEHLFQPFLHVMPAGAHVVFDKKEFVQDDQANSEGLVGTLLPLEKGQGERRIIVVGDSYTRGSGDPMNLGYVGRLGQSLASRKRPPRYQVMNAGIPGSDPVFGLELIRRKLMKYKPDIILMTVNETDIRDLKRWGGRDRFTPDGQLKSRTPSWAGLFNRSHLVRAFVLGWLGYSWEFVSPAEDEQETRNAVSEIVEAAFDAQELGKRFGFKLLILVQPSPPQLNARKMTDHLLAVEEGLRKRGVAFADLLPDFLAEIRGPLKYEYYWPLDGHYTPKGYEVYAHAVEKALKRQGLI